MRTGRGSRRAARVSELPPCHVSSPHPCHIDRRPQSVAWEQSCKEVSFKCRWAVADGVSLMPTSATLEQAFARHRAEVSEKICLLGIWVDWPFNQPFEKNMVWSILLQLSAVTFSYYRWSQGVVSRVNSLQRVNSLHIMELTCSTVCILDFTVKHSVPGQNTAWNI